MIARLFGPKAKRPPYLAHIEYWVYVTEPKLIPQEVLMGRLLRNSPFVMDGQQPLGPEHGLIFSDIRFQMALVLRTKNAHLFRPDLFESHIEPLPAAIEALSTSDALVRIRYSSRDPLPNRRHVQVMPYLVESIAYYGRSTTAFDFSAERLLEIEQLRTELSTSANADRPEMHVRAVWIPSESGGKAATRGLLKIGLPELETPESPSEHRSAVTGVLEEAAGAMWSAGELAEETPVEFMGGSFLVRVEPAKKAPLKTHILRVG